MVFICTFFLVSCGLGSQLCKHPVKTLSISCLFSLMVCGLLTSSLSSGSQQLSVSNPAHLPQVKQPSPAALVPGGGPRNSLQPQTRRLAPSLWSPTWSGIKDYNMILCKRNCLSEMSLILKYPFQWCRRAMRANTGLPLLLLKGLEKVLAI